MTNDKKDSIIDPLREPFEQIKDAGATALGVAKDFTGRVREDRAQQSSKAAGDAAGEKSVIDKVTAAAKDFGESVKRAASETSQTPQFAEAKDKASRAYASTREGAKEAYGTAKAQREAKKAAGKPDADTGTAGGAQADSPSGGATPNSADKSGEDIIDGEVISTDDPTNPSA